MKLIRPRVVSVATVLAAVAVVAWGQHSGDSVTIRDAVDNDVYAAARAVRVLARVNGDVVAAGRSVEIDAEVTGDVMAAGETVFIRGEVRDDVRAAGRSVRIGGPVGGHVVASGYDVSIASGQRVRDWAWLAGNRVEIAGSVDSLKAAGEAVSVLGEVRGDAELVGERLEVGPGAVIDGNLIWRSSKDPQISATAQIKGQIIRKPLPEPGAEGIGWAAGLFTVLTLIVSVTVLYLLFPRFAPEAARVTRAESWKALGLGLVILATVPLAVVLLSVTGVGWLLALLLVLAYVALLLLGWLVGLYAVSEFSLSLVGQHGQVRIGVRIAGIVAAVIVVLLFGQIPIAGPLFVLLVFLAGVGSIVLQAFRDYRSTISGAPV